MICRSRAGCRRLRAATQVHGRAAAKSGLKTCIHHERWGNPRGGLFALTAAAISAFGPTPLSAESALVGEQTTARPGARARLDFRIVIPPLLEMRLGEAVRGDSVAVFVGSNVRQVTLGATTSPMSADTPDPYRNRHMVLRVPGMKVLAIDANCILSHPAPFEPLYCTLAMP